MGWLFNRNKKKEESELKKIERRVGIGLLAVICLILLGVAVLLMIGIKIRFVLNDELNLVLTPLDESFTVLNGEKANASFVVTNHNFLQCKSECRFELFSLSDNKTIFSENKTLAHSESAEQSFLLSAPVTGSGERLYSFSAECHNIRTIVCPTEETPVKKIAMIVVNYELSAQDIALKDELRPKLVSLISLELGAAHTLHETNQFIDSLPKSEESFIISSRYERQISELDRATERMNSLMYLWRSEDYSALQEAYSADASLQEDLLSIARGADTLWQDALGVAVLRNNNIELIKTAATRKAAVLDLKEYSVSELNAHMNDMLTILETDSKAINDAVLQILDDSVISEEKTAIGLSDTLASVDKLIILQAREKQRGLFEDKYYKNQLFSKSSIQTITATNISFPCESLKRTQSQIRLENNLSISKRANASEILGSGNENYSAQDLYYARLEIERDALKKTKADILSDSSFGGAFGSAYVLGLIDDLLSVKEAALANIQTKSNLFLITDLDTSELDNYLSGSCRNANYSFTPQTYSIDRYLNSNFSVLDRYKIVLPQKENSSVDPESLISDNLPACCLFGECKACCDDGCKKRSPVLFIHGHSFNDANTPEYSMRVFSAIQERLAADGILDFGELDLARSEDNLSFGEWGRSGAQISVKGSYYYISYYNLGSYSFATQKSDGIENYALRLKEMIDLVKRRTGAEKVTVVAHSMGGLVLRQYLDLFGSDSVDKAVLINTPNNGVEGKVKKLCSVFNSGKECKDMEKDSIFLKRLNSNPLPSGVKLYTIRSTGCPMDNNTVGDGIVTEENSKLPGTRGANDYNDYLIRGKCTDAFNTDLHSNVLDPDKYPETYSILRKIILEQK